MGASWVEAGARVGGRFELVERLGSGGFGEVWRAADARGGDEVALKLLRPELLSDADVRERFAREARILERLEHPNIARAIEWRIEDDLAYLALELVRGLDLRSVEIGWARSGSPPPLEEVLGLFAQICAAVDHAHKRGILHRDLKPKNVMVLPRKGPAQIKVLDFGIAKILTGDAADATTVGRALGTPFYMAPEQAKGVPAEPRVDVFALGTILFELLTLHMAWGCRADGTCLPLAELDRLRHEINHPVAVFGRLGRGARPVPSAVRSSLGGAFDAVVARALAADPEARPASPAELAAEVARAARPDAAAAPVTPTAWSAPLAADTMVTPRDLTGVREASAAAPPPAPRPPARVPYALVALGVAAGATAAWLVMHASSPTVSAPATAPHPPAPSEVTAEPPSTAATAPPPPLVEDAVPQPGVTAGPQAPAPSARETPPSEAAARSGPAASLSGVPARGPQGPTARAGSPEAVKRARPPGVSAAAPVASGIASKDAVRARVARLLASATALRRAAGEGSARASALDDLILELSVGSGDPEETSLRLPDLERRLRALDRP